MDLTTPPPVSIGLPVYNGANYLEESLQSLLAQTFSDFELIISDNASTDETGDICRSYAEVDPRIRYVRQPQNLGAAENYNVVFNLSRGKYFKWAAHDDLCAPSFLKRCVDVLNERDDVVLVFSRCQEIDKDGVVTLDYSSQGEIDTANRFRRFNTIAVYSFPFIPVFGLVRRECLAQTKLIGKYAGSDRPLIGELALRGRFYEIPENLFYYRVHNEQSWGGGKRGQKQQAWYDPKRSTFSFPHWRLLFEHEHTIWRVPMSTRERIGIHRAMLVWLKTRMRALGRELVLR